MSTPGTGAYVAMTPHPNWCVCGLCGIGPDNLACTHPCCSDPDPLHDHFLRPQDCARCKAGESRG
jgi:hypothetical protein